MVELCEPCMLTGTVDTVFISDYRECSVPASMSDFIIQLGRTVSILRLFSLHTISGGSGTHGKACGRATGAPCGYPGSYANHGAEVRSRQRACEAAGS